MQADVRALRSDKQTVRFPHSYTEQVGQKHFEVLRDGIENESGITSHGRYARPKWDPREVAVKFWFSSYTTDILGYALQNSETHYVEGLHRFWKCTNVINMAWDVMVTAGERSMLQATIVYGLVRPYWEKPVVQHQADTVEYTTP